MCFFEKYVKNITAFLLILYIFCDTMYLLKIYLSCYIERDYRMADYKRIELLVKAAKLYYEKEYSQEMIAKELSLSRPYISKLLNEAKEAGIVRIQVIDPLNTETMLEQKIRERFHLEKVCIVPTSDTSESLGRLGLEAARYLDTILHDNAIIGLSWGATIYACSNALMKRTDLKNISTVQLCGGVSNANKDDHSTEIANNFSSALGAASYVIPFPAVMDSKKMKDILQTDHNISKVNQRGLDSNIALFTMGSFGLKNALVHAGYIDLEEMQALSKKGAVGDVCSHLIDIHGNICDKDLDERTVAVPLEIIKQKKYRIGVAQGLSKVDCILGALNGGIINVLITNEETAEWVLKQDEFLSRQ